MRRLPRDQLRLPLAQHARAPVHGSDNPRVCQREPQTGDVEPEPLTAPILDARAPSHLRGRVARDAAVAVWDCGELGGVGATGERESDAFRGRAQAVSPIRNDADSGLGANPKKPPRSTV